MSDKLLTDSAAREIIHNGLKNCVRCWAFDGAGSAKFGWFYIHATKKEYVGSTKTEALEAARRTLEEVTNG
jgi:hypothetical protein